MIFVDTAIGSRDLVPLLASRGLPVEEAHLEFADVEFCGRGVKGDPVLIGVEVKRLTELTGDWDRFAGVQVPKMQEPQYAHRWLVYEGEWVTERKTGALMQWAGRRRRPLHGQHNALALRKKLLTLEMCGGFHKERTYDRVETVDFLVALYRFWTDDDLDEHKSHIVHYEPIGLIPLTKAQKAFAGLPGISMGRVKAIAAHFQNSLALATSATAEEWALIEVPDEDGRVRRLGLKFGEHMVRFLHGEG